MLNNSQVLGVLKRMVADHESLAHARSVLEGYLQAQETLINLDTLKEQKQKEITELESKYHSELAARQKERDQHKAEMAGLAKERDSLRAEVESLKREANQARASIDQAVADKQAAVAANEHKIHEQEKTLERIKQEIEALKKRFAA